MNIETLSEYLGYGKVTEHIHTGKAGFWMFKTEYQYKELRVLPEIEGAPYISFLFDGNDDLIHLAFYEWHGHFNDHEDEESNVKDAVDVARQLVEGSLALKFSKNNRGQYEGGGLVSTEGLDLSSSKDNYVLFNGEVI